MPPPLSPTRRRFLRDLAVLGAGVNLLSCGDDDPWAGFELGDATFPDGVIAGPHPAGAILVVQLAWLAGPRRLGLEIGSDAGLDDLVLRATVEVAELDDDVPLHVTLESARLVPGRDYHYRWITRGAASAVGRFRVLRAADDDRPVRLGCYSCQGWQAGYFGAHAGLAAEPDLDATLTLGDYIYELTDDRGPDDRTDTIGIDGAGFAETLAEYRQKYRLYRSDPDLQAMHGRHAALAIWDNHELATEGSGLGDLVPRLSLADRTGNGKRAFWEAQPMLAGPAGRPLYRAIRFGPLVELIVLDLYSYAAPPASGGSYLGADQLAWLFDLLETSTARWKLIATSALMMGLDLSEGMPANRNQWDGFPEERAAIVAHVRSRGITGVVALSGDIHTFLAAPVTSTGRADGEVGFTEVSVGAISSEGLFGLRPGSEDTARGLEDYAREQNPHLALIEILTRGYSVVEARADEVIVTLRGVATSYARPSPMRDVAILRIPWPGDRIEVL